MGRKPSKRDEKGSQKGIQMIEMLLQGFEEAKKKAH